MRGGLWVKVAREIRSFVENPVTNLVKGLTLVIIGMSEASRTIRDDLIHGHVRVGHGLIIIGLFNILDVLPHFIDTLAAWVQFLESRQEGDRRD